jgi:predicted RNA-binding Zn-ribbon protein involved in translation (DUF1610 family)
MIISSPRLPHVLDYIELPPMFSSPSGSFSRPITASIFLARTLDGFAVHDSCDPSLIATFTWVQSSQHQNPRNADLLVHYSVQHIPLMSPQDLYEGLSVIVGSPERSNRDTEQETSTTSAADLSDASADYLPFLEPFPPLRDEQLLPRSPSALSASSMPTVQSTQYDNPYAFEHHLNPVIYSRYIPFQYGLDDLGLPASTYREHTEDASQLPTPWFQPELVMHGGYSTEIERFPRTTSSDCDPSEYGSLTERSFFGRPSRGARTSLFGDTDTTYPSSLDLVPAAQSQWQTDLDSIELDTFRPLGPLDTSDRDVVDDLTCDACGMTFQRLGDLRRHSQMHEHPSHQCEVSGCKRVFYRRDKLRDHVRQAHKGDISINEEGSINFNLPEGTTAPERTSFTCDQCHREFQAQGQLNRHLKSHSKPYKCEKCDKGFALKLDLVRHAKARHIDQSTYYDCPNAGCSFKSPRRDNLARHQRQCDKAPVPSEDLKSSTSEPTSRLQFWCPVTDCERSAVIGGRPFPRKDKMKEHALKIHGTEIFIE